MAYQYNSLHTVETPQPSTSVPLRIVKSSSMFLSTRLPLQNGILHIEQYHIVWRYIVLPFLSKYFLRKEHVEFTNVPTVLPASNCFFVGGRVFEPSFLLIHSKLYIVPCGARSYS